MVKKTILKIEKIIKERKSNIIPKSMKKNHKKMKTLTLIDSKRLIQRKLLRSHTKRTTIRTMKASQENTVNQKDNIVLIMKSVLLTLNLLQNLSTELEKTYEKKYSSIKNEKKEFGIQIIRNTSKGNLQN